MELVTWIFEFVPTTNAEETNGGEEKSEKSGRDEQVYNQVHTDEQVYNQVHAGLNELFGSLNLFHHQC